MHLDAGDETKLLGSSICTDNEVTTACARFTAIGAKGRHHTVVGKDGSGHVLKEAYLAHPTIAAMPSPAATGSLPDFIALQPDWIAPLQDLRVGEAGVGHMGLHHVSAVETLAC